MAIFDLSLPELRTYLPELDEPADLDAFWATTLQEARAFDLGLVVEPVDTGLRLIETFDVTFSGFGGDRIRAWVTRPAGCSESLPAVVEYIGSIARRSVTAENLPDWSIRTPSVSFLVALISIQLPRSGMIRHECRSLSASRVTTKSTPGERWSCETTTRSAPLIMNSPPPIIMGMSPR